VIQAKPTRVAVYTRKSTEEGLDQEFNSLHAQRDAVEALVRSRREQGWEALEDRYDDGGISGSTFDRPAFQRLLGDIKAKRVDAVAVYRLDRLSRSLLDFLRMVEFFEEQGVTFVSVSEAFDTSNPTGRLVMRVLAVFAQFERESISQRTKDKVRAARRRGQWTGGQVPLGYNLVDGALVVNEAEANRVRQIFLLYLELGGTTTVAGELLRRGWKTKTWKTRSGKLHEGAAFTKSSVRRLVGNPVYIGQVRCKGKEYQGDHEAIVDPSTWKAVQDKLGRKTKGPTGRSKHGTLLGGLARCAVCGSAFTAHHAQRHGRTYGYYSCLTVQKQGISACPGSRISVGDLEGIVMDHVRQIGRDPKLIAATVEASHVELQAQRNEVKGKRNADAQRERAARANLTIDEEELADLLKRFDPLWDELFPQEKRRVLALLIEEVRVHGALGEVEIRFRPNGIKALTEEVISA